MRATLSCLIVADDLTGACDAAAPFAARGFRTFVETTPGAGEPFCDVLSINAETRALGHPALERVYTRMKHRNLAARVFFKKIDSTLRGSVASEIALAARTLGCDAVVITPAFPAMGRIVRSGVLHVREAAPVDMRDYWRAQSLACVHTDCVGLTTEIQAGAMYVSLDAECDRDLDSIVECGANTGRRILWAGSAGLAGALARRLRSHAASARVPCGGFTAVLFCIGSTHRVTARQVETIRLARRAIAFNAEDVRAETVAEALASGRHVILSIGRISTPFRIAALLAGARAPLMLTGGDTASMVCSAVEAGAIELSGELEPGIPAGLLRGGLLDGLPVVTKAGGFGNPDTLVNIADHFTCPTT